MSPYWPSSICPPCWRGPIAARMGTLESPVIDTTSHVGLGSEWAGGYVYDVSPAALLCRASFGCKWCLFLLKRCREQQLIKWPTRSLRVRVGLGTGEDGLTFRLLLNDVKVARWNDLVAYTTLDDPAAAYIPRRPRLPDVGSPRTLALAKAYIQGCMRDHERCRAISAGRDGFKSAHQPSRLIDCRDPRRPRIISSSGTFPTYVALSYVWGEDQSHRKTKANLSSYETGIDFETLPRTIRDAIILTHQLGVDFLWVDRLCIVQDSQEDKHRELQCMLNVYRYAYLTIDAGSAEKVTDGSLQDRPPLNSDLILPFICPKGSAKKKPEFGKLYIAPASLKLNHDVDTNG
ncbi:heterokaryon incompatibility protein-domain-containing protein [Cubamyces lactineus]|nr:heterokaryon incompatibility protein-domain-containing protein [Cubamyces lactineus]